jgi:hypothetical protein
MGSPQTSNVLTGARALVMIDTNLIGIFSSCTWQLRQDKTPLFVLGKYGPGQIAPTAQEAVQMSLTGFRVFNKGPYAAMGATMLKDLLTEQDFTVKVFDRGPKDVAGTNNSNSDVNGKAAFTAFGCRITGWSSGVAARGVSDVRIEVIGLFGGDETEGSEVQESSSAVIDF